MNGARTARDLALRSRRIVTPQGVVDGVIKVANGRIVEILSPAPSALPCETIDFGDHWILPGLVDTHVHMNEPGRAEWEGFETAGRAAAAGGITTIVDMPLNSIPATTCAPALVEKAASARRCCVDVRFWGGVVPGNANELPGLAEAGARGFKCFLVPSGVDEFPHVTEDDLRLAMPVISRLGLPLLVHAELPGPIESAGLERAAEPRTHAAWLASRPPEAEIEAIRMMIRLCEEFRCAVHIVHLSAAGAIPDLEAARARGLPISVETCPHYLCFAAEDIADGATSFKCAPPIRERSNRERLWQALRDGDIDMIATDHSPCPPALKRLDSGDFFAAWGGIASLEVALAAVWTEASKRGFTLEDVTRWMSERPARLARLGESKGQIAAGRDADLVVFDSDAEWVVDAVRLRQRHPVTPYAGRRLRGRVLATYLRGATVFESE